MATNLNEKTVLVLGAYGFIGAAVVRALGADGIRVKGLVRSLKTAGRVLPGIEFVSADLRDFESTSDWLAILEDVDVVVNCAGALQDGGGDDLRAVHFTAIATLAQVCAGRGIAVVQVSAIGAEPDASTDFMRTKAEGDAALRASGVTLWCLKPGLVIGQSDYGGTALLRMLAAVPFVQPVAYPETPVQCVGMKDLCAVIAAAIRGDLAPGEYDLVEDTSHPLSQVLSTTRRWLGFPPARRTIPMPPLLTNAVAGLADLLGHLGWRSPLRSTAMAIMTQGVTGDAEPYRRATGRSLAGLEEIYNRLDSAREHRLTARMTLLMPIVVGVLSLFWLLSGVFGLTGLSQAAELLTNRGWSAGVAGSSVMFWSLVDIALGLAILWRPWAARICLAQAAIAAFYLVAATLLVPELWLDPLGPLVKVLPALMLSLIARPMLESR
ncbi:oxidoreductase [Ruegeria sp. ANG-R]|uniref:SDR family oxidoreductase n=1 Tax=Ruegeria sp. ANG-R TaxID=1577903 RepID=UPI00057E349D|nr:SDR family oxidoreductase [Ruegeria sp. ANG-R]KIC41239.1 oxidoreductase [Ruegeria sp. ANG-R]